MARRYFCHQSYTCFKSKVIFPYSWTCLHRTVKDTTCMAVALVYNSYTHQNLLSVSAYKIHSQSFGFAQSSSRKHLREMPFVGLNMKPCDWEEGSLTMAV